MAFLFRIGRRPSSGVPNVSAIITAFRSCGVPNVPTAFRSCGVPNVPTVFWQSMTTLIKREIISTENVKPSSPTPRHLQTYKLSMIDQICPPTPTVMVLYFSNSNHLSLETTTELLKHSLSRLLTRFYPLAGRISSDAQSVDCNDDGVPFVVAKIENGHGLSLSDHLENPDIKLTNQLHPYENWIWHVPQEPGSSVAMVQLTRFDCGGLAIGGVFWHGIMDAGSVGYFLKCWANTSLGSGYKEPICPNYIASSLFPPCKEAQQLGANNSLDSAMTRAKFVMRRFVLDADAISALRSKLPDNINRPSRVEITSALILRCFMAASLANEKSKTILCHAVNLRRKAHPPLPSDCFGNIAQHVATLCDNNADNNLGELVEKVRALTSKVDSEYVDRMTGDGGFSGLVENFKQIWGDLDQEGADGVGFSSFCNFGFYNMDFGWGKPELVTLGDYGNDDEATGSCNFVWLNDSRSGDGVDAWVTLNEKYIPVFDSALHKLIAAA